MADATKSKWPYMNRQDLIHATRTAIAACVSLEIARLFRLPEAYWAAITTIVIMQSTLGAAIKVSSQRFAGTVLGTLMGTLLAIYFPGNVLVFTAGVFVLGLICAAGNLDNAAYRFAGVTLAIVMLVERAGPPWVIAVHRALEVSLGIAVGLVITWVWPVHEAEPEPANVSGR